MTDDKENLVRPRIGLITQSSIPAFLSILTAVFSMASQ